MKRVTGRQGVTVLAALVVIMLIGVFATGCGSSDQPAQEETTQATEATTAAPETQATTAATTTAAQTTAAQDQNYIGEAKALEIALADAGKAETEVSYPNVHLDLDDGVYKYEVQFHQNTTEWEYEIDAVTGAIIGKDMDNDLD